VEGCAFWILNPILSFVTLIMWRNICLVSFHCSYLKQYTRYMLGVKKVKRMCGLLWQYETTILWTGKELTGNKIPYRTLRSGHQAKHKQQQQQNSIFNVHELQSELEEKLLGKSQENSDNSSNVQRHPGRDVNTGYWYALQTDGLLDISATAQVAIIIRVLSSTTQPNRCRQFCH